jgi:hypothetical protein
MTLSDLNPFRPTRWEHQRTGHHLIWFPETAELLTGDKSVYVRGSRGSGKTTLLKCICWEDLLKNASLRLQRKLEDFSYIGVYVKFPDHISSSLSHSSWDKMYPLSPDPEIEMHRFFSLAVELVCLDRCLIACHELRVDGSLRVAPTAERDIVAATFDEFPNLLPKGCGAIGFYGMARIFRSLVREMNQACGRGTVATLNEALPAREPGELLKFVTEKLADQISFRSGDSAKKIGFKFCLDDCEVLSPSQQKSVNSLVRTSNYPVAWVLSSVGSFFDTSETYIPQQPLTDHDRRIVTLDARNDEEFRSLCQSVLSLRLYFAVSDQVRTSYTGPLENFFDLRTRLGNRDVNDVFGEIIATSTASYAGRVQQVAMALRTALIKEHKKYRNKYPRGSTSYPYYEAYILLLWNGRDAFKTDFSKADEDRVPLLAPEFGADSFEAWLRRKQASALLHFSERLGFRRLPIGGRLMIAQLADGSVRDFLEIVGEIYDASNTGGLPLTETTALDRFAISRSAIALRRQTSGIYSASKSYLSGISNRSELDASTVTRFIDGLGHYTHVLQSNPDDPSVLGRAERGIFAVRFSNRRGALLDSALRLKEDLVWKVIRQAELAGYIRASGLQFAAGADRPLSEIDTRIVSFRLHRRFAPHYRFSYRGAYEPVILDVDDLASLLDRGNKADSESWAKQMATRYSRQEETNQLQLPFVKGSFDE